MNPIAEGANWREQIIQLWRPTTLCEPLNVFQAVATHPYFWLMLVIIAWLGVRRFDATRLQSYQFDPPIPNRFYTTTFRYYFAAGVYAFILMAAFSGIILILSVEDFLRVIVALIEQVGLNFAPASEGLCIADEDGRNYLLPTNEQFDTLRAQIYALATNDPAWTAAETETVTLEQRMIAVITGAFGFFLVFTTLPYVTPQDMRLRDWLHAFASVPTKARLVADQIICGVAFPEYISERYLSVPQEHVENRWSDIRTFLGIRAIVDEFMEEAAIRYPTYKAFFLQMNPNLQRLQDRVDLLHDNIEVSDKNRRYYNVEMANIVQQMALLLACAVLKNETDEYHTALRLKQFGVTNVETPTFRFSLGLIGLSAVVILAAWAISLIGAGLGVMYSVSGAIEPSRIVGVVGSVLFFGVTQGLVTVFFFALPLTIAAGVRSFLSDRFVVNNGADASSNTLSYAFFAFVLSMGVVMLLSFVTTANTPSLCTVADTPMQIYLVWSAPPALLAAAFVLITGPRGITSPILNGAFDFLLTAVLTGAAYYFVIAYSMSLPAYAESLRCLAREQYGANLTAAEIEALIRYGYAIAGGVIPGALAAIVARASRQSRAALGAAGETITETREAGRRARATAAAAAAATAAG